MTENSYCSILESISAKFHNTQEELTKKVFLEISKPSSEKNHCRYNLTETNRIPKRDSSSKEFPSNRLLSSNLLRQSTNCTAIPDGVLAPENPLHYLHFWNGKIFKSGFVLAINLAEGKDGFEVFEFRQALQISNNCLIVLRHVPLVVRKADFLFGRIVMECY